MIKKISRYSCIGVIACFMSLVNLSIVLAEEEVLRISLKDAITMAIKASEDIQIQDNEVARSNFQMQAEKSELFPHVYVSSNWSRNFEYPNIPATAAKKEYDFNTGVTLEQKLLTFGRVFFPILAAREKIKVNQWNREASEQEIIYITKLAYYDVYFAKRILKIAQASYELSQENKDILDQRSAQGRVSKYDNIRISANIAARKPTVNNAQANYYSAIETLKVAVGAKPAAKIELTEGFLDEYQPLERDELVLALYNNQPSIKALAKTIEEKEYLIKSKRAAYYPEISAFATWNHQGTSNDYKVDDENLEDYGVAGLKVNIPIFTGGKTSAELHQAKIDKQNAELMYQKDRKNYLLQLDKALSEYREYVKTLEANQEAVRLAQESFNLSQDLFRSGQISVNDLNDAELGLTNQKIGKETTLFNINITLAKIKKLAVTEAISE